MYSVKPFAISTVIEGGIASSVRLTTASTRTGPSWASAAAIPPSTSPGSSNRIPRTPTASASEERQQGGQCRAHISNDAQINRCAATNVLRPDIDLRDLHASALGVELPIRKVCSEHEQHIAVEHRVVAGREADQPSHPNVIWVIPLDVLLATHRMYHGCLETPAK
jgi:hypothetical protein